MNYTAWRSCPRLWANRSFIICPQRMDRRAAIFFYATYGRDSIYAKPIELAMASVHYPDHGLPMLISGETGVGKTFFARLTYQYAVAAGVVKSGCPFVSFNCADYSNNPQLVSSVLFGHKKGAYTGAVSEQGGHLDHNRDPP